MNQSLAMVDERMAKLRAHVDALQILTIYAYERFLFVRPMMVDQQLIERLGSNEKAAGFGQLRMWLYWSFVQELVKICSDTDHRTPSINKLKAELDNPETLQMLEDEYSRPSPRVGDDAGECWQQQAQREEAELRSEFKKVHNRCRNLCDKILSSNAAEGYKKVRNKLISHNELGRKSDGEYSFLDIKELQLKFGNERKLLEDLKAVVDDLTLLIQKTEVAWDSIFEWERKLVCDFWKIKDIEISDFQAATTP